MESQVCASETRETLLHRHMGNMKPGEASLRSDRLQASSGNNITPVLAGRQSVDRDDVI